MVDLATGCALCGLPLPRQPALRVLQGDERRFCCEGCARVYELALENGLLDQALPCSSQAEEPPEERLFRSGTTVPFSIRGMWCASCAVVAERVLARQEGVFAADVSFAGEHGTLRYDPARADPGAVLRILGRLGYQAQLLTQPSQPPADHAGERLILQLIAALAFGMHVMTLYVEVLYPAYALGRLDGVLVRRVEHLVWLLATPALFLGGHSILAGAWRGVRARAVTMDTLVALGVLAAYGYSACAALAGGAHVYFDSVTMVVTFVTLGRVLEHYGGMHARREVRQLLCLQPHEARRRAGDGWATVAAADLSAGDEVKVCPGERAPADAEVLEGTGEADESLLTGESAPVAKRPGDTLFAGTVVQDGALTCRVKHPPGETRLAQIASIVEQTLASKPPAQRLADRAAAGLTWVALASALLAALWRLAGGEPASGALLAAITTLVVACPCSLGLATPLALVAALGRAARKGVLVRNPLALQSAARVNWLVFDKTGTLTRGRMSVACVQAAEGYTEAVILRLAAAVEQQSVHPVARAILSEFGTPPPPARDLASTPGQGARGCVDGRAVRVGTARFAGVDGAHPLVPEAQERAARGETVVWVGLSDGACGPAAVVGFIALADAPNPTAGKALRELAGRGIGVQVLSGDDPRTVEAAGRALGVAGYEGGCSPEAKAEWIRKRQAAGDRVAMVGDGVNDAPALARADVAITVAGGTAVAGETSDIILMQSDLALVPWALDLLRRTHRVTLGNLAWAAAYNVVAIPLAVTGQITPIHAAAAMAASSVLVVLNSLRLSRGR